MAAGHSPRIARDSAAARYVVAFGSAFVAAALRMVLTPLLSDRFPLLTFYLALMLSGWFGGLWPGIVSTLASAVIAEYFWLDPIGSLRVSRAGDLVALGLFVLTGLVISILNELRHRSEAREREARGRAERAREDTSRLANEVRAAQQRVSHLVASVPGVVWEAWGQPDDASQRIDFVSGYVETLLGYSVDEWLRTPNFWLTIVHADDRTEAARVAHEAFAAGGPHVNCFRWIKKNGEVVWVEAHATVMHDDAGQPIGMRGVTLDITERHEAEAALRASLDRSVRLSAVAERLSQPLQLPDIGSAVLTHAIEALGGQAGALRLLGDDGTTLRLIAAAGVADEVAHRFDTVPVTASFPMAAAIRGREGVFIESSADRWRRYPAGFADAIEQSGFGAGVSVPLMFEERTLGGLTVAYDHDRAFSDGDRRFIGTLARLGAQAIERSRLFEAERLATREAEDANRMKDRFLAMVSHEMRAPLNAVLGWADMLRSGTLNEERRNRAIEAVYANAKRQTRLIDDLLDVARMMSGNLPLERTPVDLRAAIRVAIDVVQRAAEDKHIHLVVDADPSVGMPYGDQGRLQQVLWNLLSNAIKFTPEGGEVRLRVRRAENGIEMVVTDTGRGIRPDFLPFVFDPFRQADPLSTRSHGGLGLGLAIVKHLVEAHGGTVRAESAGDGAGSTFSVRLPIVAEVMTSSTDGTTPLHDVPVLVVVDGDAETRELVVTCLEHAGARVMTAGSAADALSLLQRERVAVLLCDIAMPTSDGYSLLRTIRASESPAIASIPAAALTSLKRDEDRRRVLRSGFQLHVAKPIDGSSLVEAVAALIHSGV